ncbi:unnamed protein product [Rotaria sp. Silwood2]|nr:unnamed protein product [Rotaria sp. Silwood2]
MTGEFCSSLFNNDDDGIKSIDDDKSFDGCIDDGGHGDDLCKPGGGLNDKPYRSRDIGFIEDIISDCEHIF